MTAEQAVAQFLDARPMYELMPAHGKVVTLDADLRAVGGWLGDACRGQSRALCGSSMAGGLTHARTRWKNAHTESLKHGCGSRTWQPLCLGGVAFSDAL